MIYKFDIKKKKEYLSKLILFSILCTLGLFLLCLSFEGFVIVNVPGFLAPIFLFLIFEIFVIIKASKNYDSAELEFTGEEIILSWKGRKTNIKYSEIKKIFDYPNFFDKQQIIVSDGNWHSVAIHSFYENFDEIRKTLEAINPIEQKSGKHRKVLNIFLIVGILLGFIAGSIPNYPVTIIFLGVAIAACVFNLVRYAKSFIKRSTKIFYIVCLSFLTFSFTMSLLTNILLSLTH